MQRFPFPTFDLFLYINKDFKKMFSKPFGEGQDKGNFPFFLRKALGSLVFTCNFLVFYVADASLPWTHPLCPHLISVVAVMYSFWQVQSPFIAGVLLKLRHPQFFCILQWGVCRACAASVAWKCRGVSAPSPACGGQPSIRLSKCFKPLAFQVAILENTLNASHRYW